MVNPKTERRLNRCVGLISGISHGVLASPADASKIAGYDGIRSCAASGQRFNAS
jgi:hypothetical protein